MGCAYARARPRVYARVCFMKGVGGKGWNFGSRHIAEAKMDSCPLIDRVVVM